MEIREYLTGCKAANGPVVVLVKFENPNKIPKWKTFQNFSFDNEYLYNIVQDDRKMPYKLANVIGFGKDKMINLQSKQNLSSITNTVKHIKPNQSSLSKQPDRYVPKLLIDNNEIDASSIRGAFGGYGRHKSADLARSEIYAEKLRTIKTTPLAVNYTQVNSDINVKNNYARVYNKVTYIKTEARFKNITFSNAIKEISNVVSRQVLSKEFTVRGNIYSFDCVDGQNMTGTNLNNRNIYADISPSKDKKSYDLFVRYNKATKLKDTKRISFK